jgi:hypothetical protein
VASEGCKDDADEEPQDGVDEGASEGCKDDADEEPQNEVDEEPQNGVDEEPPEGHVNSEQPVASKSSAKRRKAKNRKTEKLYYPI